MKHDEAIKQVEEGVRKSLQPFIGKRNDDDIRDAIIGAMASFLPSCLPKQETKLKMSKAWDKMKLVEKVKWWLVNCLFPDIGKAVRSRQAALNYARQREEYELQSYLFDQSTVITQELPLWALKDPHSVFILDAAFTMPVPVEIIKFDATLRA